MNTSNYARSIYDLKYPRLPFLAEAEEAVDVLNIAKVWSSMTETNLIQEDCLGAVTYP